MSIPHWLRPPPPIRLPASVGRFDQAVDAWFDDHLRGRPLADRVFYSASALGDHGMIWFIFALAQTAGRAIGLDDPAPSAETSRTGQWWLPLARAAAGLSAESALVNGPIKWLFRRRRPLHEGTRPLYLRLPRTSSFPSGHATSAFFAAALLRDEGNWPIYYLAAVLVAASRVHVKIHHASDVIGGAAIGVVLGEWARHLMPMESGGPFRR